MQVFGKENARKQGIRIVNIARKQGIRIADIARKQGFMGAFVVIFRVIRALKRIKEKGLEIFRFSVLWRFRMGLNQRPHD